MRKKLNTDASMYANEKQEVRYALSQMKNSIFDTMFAWIKDTNVDLTVKSFFEKIENCMRFHHQINNTKKKFLIIKMKNNENVFEYYHRIFKLWQRAKILMKNRIEKFLIILKFEISSSLIEKNYTNFKKLLKTTRRIEIKRKNVAHIFSKQDNKSNKFSTDMNRNLSRFVASSQNSNFESIRKTTSLSQNTSEFFNEKFELVSLKLNEWVDKRFDDEKNSSKLQSKNKKRLIKQNKCWSCRDSRHKEKNFVCINYDRKKKLNKLDVANLDKFEFESDFDSKKEWFLIRVAIRNGLKMIRLKRSEYLLFFLRIEFKTDIWCLTLL